MTSPSNLRTQTRIAKVECSKLFDRSGMRMWLFFILYSCRCWQIYVGDCLGWYYQFWTYSPILSKMFLPKSIQINMILGTSVLSETSSEFQPKKEQEMTSIDFPTFHALCGFFEGCWSLRRARHWVISPPSRFVDWWLPGMPHIVLGQTGGVQRLWCCSWKWTAQSASECQDYKVIQGYTMLYMDRSQMILGKVWIEWERDIDPRASWSSMFPIQILFSYLAINPNKKC